MIRIAAALLLVALARPAMAEPLAILHARAFPIASAPVEDATILIDNGHILSIAAHGAAPPGARVIDAAGRIVTPGLVNPATQLGLAEVAEASDTVDHSVEAGPLGAAFDVAPAINPNSTLIPVARADGLTRAMIYPGAAATTPFSGAGATIRLVPEGDPIERRRAAVFVTVGNGSLAKAGGSRAAQWALLRNALDEARRYAARKTTGPRDQLLNHLDAEALAPVLAGTVPLAIRADRESDIREALRLASEAHIRVVLMGGAEAWRVAGPLAAAHVPVILDAELNLPVTFDAVGARLDNAALLAKAGVTIAFSVSGNGIYLSYDAGLAMRGGAGLAVANGLPYADALKAVTLAPARIWDMAGGILAPGADADIVIWDGDPLEPSSAPTTVLIAGKPVSLATRQSALAARYAPARANDPMPPAYR